ncbi:Dor1-like family-domain-containing protein [Rhexocercosporidium sp. MPI-PUGE-AT-0058]|nr:Dor1-like family-domain-containing protein [Rhexocercosporidium sp. MPI-PUGE-AT-0058]
MADPLYELLVPYFNTPSPRPAPSSKDPTTNAYLNRLTTLPLSSLTSSEPQSLSQTTHSLLLSLQGLSKRSHKSIIDSSTHLSTISTTLPSLAQSTASLRDALPKLDDAAIHFSETYNTRSENPLLDRRRKALLLSRNIDRLSDILDLPTLLSSAISTSNTASASATTSSNATLNYASALDLNSHIRRLHGLYPSSALISSVEKQAEDAMQDMATNLIASLKTSSLKLASAMRTISWLRRVAPELDPTPPSSLPAQSQSHSLHHTGVGGATSREGSLGSLFLVCRLANLQQTLSALEPLRELADQETLRLQEGKTGENGAVKERSKWEGGQQTERYLKRYIEIFREQSFAIISMYRSIFPAGNSAQEEAVLKGLGREKVDGGKRDEDPLQPLPSSLGTFPLRLVGMLEETLRRYLPNVRDRSSRDSLLTQVLYCAGSLGRLGGDFSLLLAFLGEGSEEGADDGEEEEDGDEEWVEVIRKHRVLAGRLELMVGARDG